MPKVNNRKTILRLAFRSLKAAKLRNGMAVCAIALTAVLFTTLFTLGVGTVDAFQQSTMRQSGSSAHAVIKYIDDAAFETIRSHPLIDEIAYNRMLADSVDNEELLKRHGELWYMDDAGIAQGFYEPVEGHRPLAANEIMMDTKTMQLLGVPQQIGAPVSLNVTIRGQQVKRDFVLSGWWESDPAFNASILIASESYTEQHSDELRYTYPQDNSFAGIINAYINFSNTFGMQKKLDRIITESGFDPVDETAANYVDSNLNWAYLSAGMGGDPVTIIALLAAALLIAFAGYLIIYNIFQISVLRDIRYYGLLKTIGTTGRQIKRIIRIQAGLLSLVGIPVGLILGYGIGIKLVPMILPLTSHAGSNVSMSTSPLIFLGAGAFVLLTVWISTRKPGKIAAGVSPVEAVRYMDVDGKNNAKEKPSADGGKLYKMALSNLGRNKKRTLLVLISLSLSLVVLNCVFTLSRGMDMDKYLSQFVDTDFLVAHADYFNNRYHSGFNAVEEGMIADIEALPSFEEGGRLYQTDYEAFTADDPNFDGILGVNGIYGVAEDQNPFASVYGLDDLPLERLEVIEGELDLEKLRTGKYILAGISLDDFGRPELDSAVYGVGDKVTLHNYRLTDSDGQQREYTTQEYEVMATVKIKTYTNTNRSRNPYTFYLPADVYLPLTQEKAIMSYAFNAKEGKKADVESFMQEYTETVEPMMSFESKSTKENEFVGMRNLFLSIGGVLSFIIGLIGILNFINSMLTSIITRRQEFAVLQSIGMTTKQLRNMLCLEGLYYAGGTIALSLALGVLTSVAVMRCLFPWWFWRVV